MTTMTTQRWVTAAVAGLVICSSPWSGVSAQEPQLITVPLTYHAPAPNTPRPNFSPKGTQVTLATVSAGMTLPSGAQHPAKRGLIQVGPARSSWIPVLATASAAHPNDLTRLYVDLNRNNNFTDDGPPVTTTPSQNDKTKAWWSSFSAVVLKVRFAEPEREEPYIVNFWIVREDGAAAPDVLRYSRGSWRAGATTVNGVRALVAAMDGNNDALYGPGDSWTVIQASMPDAATAVLSLKESRNTSRLMFLERPNGRDVVLEFKSFARDGSSVTFAVVDRPVTKAEDRLPDDMLADERPRPRTTTPLTWSHDLEDAVATAKASGKRVFIDFETSWCGPCKTMDEWIWTDKDVAAALAAGYILVKLDGDIEKAAVARFKVGGYPTMVIVDPATGAAVKSVSGYKSSEQILAFVR
jgi:thiol-disulfide isomerase/thioredoxin